MKAVLDANIAVKWVPPEHDPVKSARLRDEFQRGLHQFISPDIFPIEVAHALARAERRKLILPGEGWTKTVIALAATP